MRAAPSAGPDKMVSHRPAQVATAPPQGGTIDPQASVSVNEDGGELPATQATPVMNYFITSPQSACVETIHCHSLLVVVESSPSP